MEKWSLQALAEGLLRHGLGASGRCGARIVTGGHPHSPRQAVIALRRGQTLDEHHDGVEATVQVLRGRVRAVAGDDVTDGTAGQLLIVPGGRPTVTALQDSVVLLTVGAPRVAADAAPAGAGSNRRIAAPARGTVPSRGYRADRRASRRDAGTAAHGVDGRPERVRSRQAAGTRGVGSQ
ncbi:LuxR family transcriptional regulator [Dactylosporangium sp. NPDC050688]|uniref:LuxR family transcriptional regulator n=1 Tax=Dactylosporangium sp. NPDC050688 TaxID=3157217 RepID=UPI00340BBA7D